MTYQVSDYTPPQPNPMDNTDQKKGHKKLKKKLKKIEHRNEKLKKAYKKAKQELAFSQQLATERELRFHAEARLACAKFLLCHIVPEKNLEGLLELGEGDVR